VVATGRVAHQLRRDGAVAVSWAEGRGWTRVEYEVSRKLSCDLDNKESMTEYVPR
jgi:hypothetical protein